MGYIFLIAIIGALFLGASQKGCGIKCFSFRCRYNKSGKCERQEITVYDNTIKGLCLNHTDSMDDRVIEPLLNSGWSYGSKREIRIVSGGSKKKNGAMTDEKLLKNPAAFSKWMMKRGDWEQG